MLHTVLRKTKVKCNPFRYLLDGSKREVEPVILQGDPDEVYGVIKQATWNERYTNLVLSWEETISLDKVQDTIASYEATTFAGFEDRDIARCWILHQDKGRTEAHCVVANTHLSSGKSYVHFESHRDMGLLKSWQEVQNIENGWSDITDPALARWKSTPAKNLPKEKKELFKAVDDMICAQLEAGEIEDRAGIVKSLEAAGYLVRATKNISIRRSEDDRPIRLSGFKYAQDFNLAEYKASQADAAEDFSKRSEELPEKRAELASRVAKRAKDIAKYAKRTAKTPSKAVMLIDETPRHDPEAFPYPDKKYEPRISSINPDHEPAEVHRSAFERLRGRAGEIGRAIGQLAKLRIRWAVGRDRQHSRNRAIEHCRSAMRKLSDNIGQGSKAVGRAASAHGLWIDCVGATDQRDRRFVVAASEWEAGKSALYAAFGLKPAPLKRSPVDDLMAELDADEAKARLDKRRGFNL